MRSQTQLLFAKVFPGLVERYLYHQDIIYTSAAQTPADLIEAISRYDSLASAISSMRQLNSTLVGDWIDKSCGIPPSTGVNDTTKLNWKRLPHESYIQTTWAKEKSEFAVLRVYFSEFNVIQSTETLVSSSYIFLSQALTIGLFHLESDGRNRRNLWSSCWDFCDDYF